MEINFTALNELSVDTINTNYFTLKIYRKCLSIT